METPHPAERRGFFVSKTYNISYRKKFKPSAEKSIAKNASLLLEKCRNKNIFANHSHELIPPIPIVIPCLKTLLMRTITFDYNGYELSADVYYNFESISDLIAVVPKENTFFKETILLFKEQGKWITDLLFLKKYPATIKSLTNAVKKVCRI